MKPAPPVTSTLKGFGSLLFGHLDWVACSNKRAFYTANGLPVELLGRAQSVSALYATRARARTEL